MKSTRTKSGVRVFSLGVIAQVLLDQRKARLLLIGDRHQNIYGFRGSRNTLKEFSDLGATVLKMPKTWRFGPRTAMVVNEILGRLKGETTKVVGMGADALVPAKAQMAVLARTNAALFGVAANRRGRGVHWVGGIENYRVEMVHDAFRLYAGNLGEVCDPMMRKYASWDQYEAEALATKDKDARIMIKLVGEYRADIPGLVRELRSNAQLSEKDADLVLTSGHKAKGLQWDYVRVGEDFECINAAVDEIALGGLTTATEQEVNLLYVVISRAQKAAVLNRETNDWLARNGVVLPVATGY